MANEAVLVVRQEEPINMTIADGTSVPKGTILKLSDPNTVAPSSASGDIPAGIMARDKIANDGRTQAAVFRKGIFDLTVSATGAVTAGELVVIAGANTITRMATTGLEPDDIKLALGRALEDGSANEVIRVAVNL